MRQTEAVHYPRAGAPILAGFLRCATYRVQADNTALRNLYRLKKIEEAYDFGIEEYLDNAFLCIIEWPETYEEELADLPHHEMTITNHGDYREIVFH